MEEYLYALFFFHSLSLEKVEKFEERILLVNEFVTNDNIYLRDMQTMHELYYSPLKGVLDPEEFEGVFANFENVYDVALEVNERIRAKKVQGLAEYVRENFLSLTENYEYTANYTTAWNTWHKLVEKCQVHSKERKWAHFIKIVRAAEADPRSHGGVTLRSMLRRSFHRLDCYLDIVEGISKVTPKKSYVYPSIISLMDDLRALCRGVDDARRRKEGMKMMKCHEIYHPLRLLVREYKLKIEVAPYHIPMEKVQCYLFNDMFYFREADETAYGFSFLYGNMTIVDDRTLKLRCMNLKMEVKIHFRRKCEKEKWFNLIRRSIFKMSVLVGDLHLEDSFLQVEKLELMRHLYVM